MSKGCICCGGKGEELYGYLVCDACRKKMGLFTDKTIARWVSENKGGKPALEEEMRRRLEFIETDYVKKKIKLMHVMDRLKVVGGK